jgi:hypothetical protein
MIFSRSMIHQSFRMSARGRAYRNPRNLREFVKSMDQLMACESAK